MKMRLIITLLCVHANLLSITPSLSAQQDTQIILTKEDQQFLNMPIQHPLSFAADAKDPLVNEAAIFLNELEQRKTLKSYQELLDALISKDKELSTSSTPIIPGAFVDACATLYSAPDIIADDFPNQSLEEQTQEVIHGKEEALNFAGILLKEAKILNLQSVIPNQSEQQLRNKLEEAKRQGQVISKVYVYSVLQNPAPIYQDLRVEFPNIELVFRPFPPVFTAFIKEAEEITDGLVFVDSLPTAYPALYQPEWFSLYNKYSVSKIPAFAVGSLATIDFYNHYYKKQFHHHNWHARPSRSFIHAQKPHAVAHPSHTSKSHWHKKVEAAPHSRHISHGHPRLKTHAHHNGHSSHKKTHQKHPHSSKHNRGHGKAHHKKK